MVSIDMLAVYIGALAVLFAAPGPDMALVLQTSTVRGVKHGFATLVGLAIARAAHVTLSACGVAALLRTAPWLYDGMRIAGALYLTYVAIQIFRSPLFELGTAAQPATPAPPLRRAMARGMLSNILNPKALLFCSVLLPQFVNPDAPVWPQVVVLGTLLVATGIAFDCLYVLGAVRLSGWLRQHPRAQMLQRWSFSAALLAFAVRLSLD
jgi:threonine/homoserine/homoserine lactone efflux protein